MVSSMVAFIISVIVGIAEAGHILWHIIYGKKRPDYIIIEFKSSNKLIRPVKSDIGVPIGGTIIVKSGGDYDCTLHKLYAQKPVNKEIYGKFVTLDGINVLEMKEITVPIKKPFHIKYEIYSKGEVKSYIHLIFKVDTCMKYGIIKSDTYDKKLHVQFKKQPPSFLERLFHSKNTLI